MRLSDAIALGRVLIKSVRGTNYGDDGASGCAQGMAEVALGIDRKKSCYEWNGQLAKVYPWMLNPIDIAPCGCRVGVNHSYAGDARGVIAHLNDEHLFGVQDWTLEQIIDWVRSVEPPELEETANGDRAETSAATEPVCVKTGLKFRSQEAGE